MGNGVHAIVPSCNCCLHGFRRGRGGAHRFFCSVWLSCEQYDAADRHLRVEWARREAVAERLRRDIADEQQDLGMLHQARSRAERAEPL